MGEVGGFLERLLYFKLHAIFLAGGLYGLVAGRDGGERLAGLALVVVTGFLVYRKWMRMEAEAATREARARERARREE